MLQKLITFQCIVKNKQGKIVGESFNRDIIAEDESADSQLKELTKALKDLNRGDKKMIALTAADAYGYYDITKVHFEPRHRFNGPLKVGQFVWLPELNKNMRISSLTSESVVFDQNHPLAGQDLIFEIEVYDTKFEDSVTFDPPQIHGQLIH
jgi:FKBP-type peptidyl-prolyl cis-trans isomerase SlyD